MAVAVALLTGCVPGAAAAGPGQRPSGLLPALPPSIGDPPGLGAGKAKPAVRVRTSPPRERSLVRTLPIGRRPAARPVSVASLSLNRLGQLRRGVGLEVSGELQVTVCLKPRSGPRRRRGDCVGRVYGYDPRIRLKLALAPSGRSSGRRAYTVGHARTLNCRQRQPNRNHHCAISVPWRRIELGSGSRGMPGCAPRGCRLNLIASASDPRALARHRVVVGGIDRRQRIDNVGETRISVVRYRRGTTPAEPEIARRARRARVPLVRKGRKLRLRSVYSVPLERLRSGDRLKLDGRYSGAIGHLPYNSRNRTRIVLADRPGAIRPGPRARRASRGSAYVNRESNFNCTRGPSGHRTPCPVRRTGVLRIKRDVGHTLYANLIAGHGAIGRRADRHRRRDRVRVRRGGFLKVWRYPRDYGGLAEVERAQPRGSSR